MSELYNQVYEIVKQIPVGKVATYGQIAHILGNDNLGRQVGHALHLNPDESSIPCHRVVNSKGELAFKYAFGGINIQEEKLLKEGVIVKNHRVDLSIYRW